MIVLFTLFQKAKSIFYILTKMIIEVKIKYLKHLKKIMFLEKCHLLQGKKD